MKKIAVHNEKFHADDVFAVAIIKLIYPKVEIIRTRDEKELKKVDAKIDVGGKYNHETKDYDHHQKGGAGGRENGIPYASAGLIWKHYGEKLTNSKKIAEEIDKKIIQQIDADDNGIKTYKAKEEPYTISNFITSLNPQWPNNKEKDFDREFYKAVPIIMTLLKKEVENAKTREKAEKIILEKLKTSNKNYLILETHLPWKKTLIEKTNLKYVITKGSVNEDWAIIAVPKALSSFECRKPLPKEWAGLSNEKLAKVTGVKGSIFCHNKRFIAVAKSKEEAVKLVELALNSS